MNTHLTKEHVRDEQGHIVVEAVVVFVPFIILIALILSLIEFAFIHIRVQHALAQTAQQVSMYSYLIDVTGTAEAIGAANQVSSDVRDVKQNTEKIIEGLNTLKNFSDSTIGKAVGTFGEIGESLENIINTLKPYAEDPKGSIELLGRAGIGWVVEKIAFVTARKIFESQFNVIDQSDGYERFRKRYGIDVYDFHLDADTADDKNRLTLTYTYEFELTLGRFLLPFNPKISTTQSVMTKLWMGKGERYGKK